MRLRLAGLSAIILAMFAGCPAVAQTPGSTRVIIKNPDPAKWSGRSNFFGNSTGEFVCRPLACPDSAKVVASISNSPTRSPDPKALAKLANQIPDAVAQANANAAPGRKLDRISSSVSNVRGYPAIVQDLRVVGDNRQLYLSKATLFVKSALVSFSSYSPSLELARRNRDLFTRAMSVEDTPIQ